MLLLALGCGDPCEGSACDVVSTTLSLTRGDDAGLGDTERSPLDAELVFLGGDARGVDWSALVGPGFLLAGSLDADAVLSVDFRVVGEDVAVDDALFGSLVGEGAFGAAIARLDDWLLVGAPERDVGGGKPSAGSAWLSEDGGRGWTGDRSEQSAVLVLLGEEPHQQVGSQVALCQLDDDGVPDVLVSAAWDHTGAKLGGRVFVSLSSEGREPEMVVGALSLSWWSTQEGAQFGRALACADLDGDGLDEVLIGAPFADGSAGDATGAVYVLQAPFEAGAVDEQAQLVIEGFTPQSYLGWSIATGDLDGDGVLELFGGAPGAQGGLGAVGVWTVQGSLRTLYQGLSGRRGNSTNALNDQVGGRFQSANVDPTDVQTAGGYRENEMDDESHDLQAVADTLSPRDPGLLLRAGCTDLALDLDLSDQDAIRPTLKLIRRLVNTARLTSPQRQLRVHLAWTPRANPSQGIALAHALGACTLVLRGASPPVPATPGMDIVVLG